MRAVNLLPRDAERLRARGGRAPLLVAGGGIAAASAAAIVLVLGASGANSDRQAQLEAVEAAIARARAVDDAGLAPGVVTRERRDRMTALSAALATRVPLDGLLQQIALVLPADAWLTGLTAAAPSSAPAQGASPSAPAAPAATEGVTILGATYSQLSVARVLSRLAAIPTLADVRLAASARAETPARDAKAKKASPKTVVTFSISARLRTGATS